MKLILVITLFSNFLFADKFVTILSRCKTCHGRNFEKSAFNTSKIVKDLTSEEIFISLRGYKSRSKSGRMHKIMESQVQNISMDDLKLLSTKIN